MEICSVCKKEFKTLEEYLAHTCTTGFTPADFEHQVALNPDYPEISASALSRGAKE